MAYKGNGTSHVERRSDLTDFKPSGIPIFSERHGTAKVVDATISQEKPPLPKKPQVPLISQTERYEKEKLDPSVASSESSDLDSTQDDSNKTEISSPQRKAASHKSKETIGWNNR